MKYVQIYPFSLRMGRLLDIGRDSYVGQRIYPRLALLYASSMVYRDQGHYEFIRDYIQSYVEDTYYDLYSTNSNYQMSLSVPTELSSRAFLEILRGAEMLIDIAADLGEEFIECIHFYKVIINPLENTLVVVKHDKAQ